MTDPVRAVNAREPQFAGLPPASAGMTAGYILGKKNGGGSTFRGELPPPPRPARTI